MKKKILLTTVVLGTVAAAILATGGKDLNFNAIAQGTSYTMALEFENSGTYKYLANWEIGAGSFTRQTMNGNDVTFSVSGMEEMWGVFAKAPDTGSNVISNTTAISGISRIAVTTAFTAAYGGYEIEIAAESTGPKIKYAEKNISDPSDTWVDSHTKVFDLPVNANYFTFKANSAWIYSIEITYSCTPADVSAFNAYANKVNSEKDLLSNLVNSKYSNLKSEMLYANQAPDGRDSVLKVEVESNHYEWPRFTLDLGKSYNLSNSTMTLDTKLVTAQAGPYASIYALLDSNGNKVNASEINLNARQNEWSSATVTSTATDVRYVVISYQCASASDVLYLDNLNVYSNTRGEAIEIGKVYTMDQAKTGKFNMDINFTSERSWNSRFLIVFYDWDEGGTYSVPYEIEGNNSIYNANTWTANPAGVTHAKTIGSYERFEVNVNSLIKAGDGKLEKVHAIQILNYGNGDATAGYIDFNA
ncbi:MAG: hypothetical protein MJ248_03770 [Bacilli bacterium]|nr:hypothetical protein [Bacilli bacterium]